LAPLGFPRIPAVSILRPWHTSSQSIARQQRQCPSCRNYKRSIFYYAKINLPFCFESAHLIANLEDPAAQPPLPSASSPARRHPQTREPRAGLLFVYGGEGFGYG